MVPKSNFEIINKKVLKRSVIFTIIYTLIALTVGFLTKSQVIIFDGIFNLAGVALTYLSIFSLKFINKRDSLNYPYGKETFEPFIAITQYFIILYICITTITSSVQVILEGGHIVNTTYGMLYGLLTAIFSIGVYVYLKIITKNNLTSIGQLELDQWKFGCLLSIGILIGFAISWVMEKTEFAEYSYYTDPALTIIITIIFGRTAIFAIKGCVRELLMAKPSEEIVKSINKILEAVNKKYELSNHILRLGKVGGKLIIEIGYIVKKKSKMDSIEMQDRLRKELTEKLICIPYEKWINVTFTGDMKWAELY
ncbi:MAG: cation transporter [Defluviitaleaceae bacterium]|nr:cation transporter [Defluviitaleaceae bacterium]